MQRSKSARSPSLLSAINATQRWGGGRGRATRRDDERGRCAARRRREKWGAQGGREGSGRWDFWASAQCAERDGGTSSPTDSRPVELGEERERRWRRSARGMDRRDSRRPGMGGGGELQPIEGWRGASGRRRGQQGITWCERRHEPRFFVALKQREGRRRMRVGAWHAKGQAQRDGRSCVAPEGTDAYIVVDGRGNGVRARQMGGSEPWRSLSGGGP